MAAQLCRASELFDWLRGLPENHELAHLCDVYTYTTIISQCGSHQQLRKALELVAEMRGHGVMCNVHTYSALMNVCIKVSFHNDICNPLAQPRQAVVSPAFCPAAVIRADAALRMRFVKD